MYFKLSIQLSGEAADVDPDIVNNWLELNKPLLERYQPSEIYNFDESRLEWLACPKRSIQSAGVSKSGTKERKDAVTVAFFVNVAGGKEKAILPASELHAEEDHMVISPSDECAFRPSIEYENALEIEVSLLFIW